MRIWSNTFAVNARYDAKQTRRWLTIYFGKVLPVACILGLLYLPLSTLVLILGRFAIISIPADASPDVVLSLCSAIVHFVGGQCVALLLGFITLFFVFVPFAIVAWFAVKASLNLIFPLFCQMDYTTARLSARYDHFFSHKLRRWFLLCHCMFVFFAAVGSLRVVQITGISANVIIHLTGITLCLGAPYVFGFTWCVFLRVLRRKEKTGRHVRWFKKYLFSDESLRSSFLLSVKFMVYIALLAWVLIPVPVKLSSIAAQRTLVLFRFMSPEYQVVLSQAQQEVTIRGGHSWDEVLPPADRLYREFDMWADIRENLRLGEEGLLLFLRYLFFVVALAALFGMALPVLIRGIRERGYRIAIKKLLIASVKTTTVVIVMRIFVSKAFLIDFSNALGLGTIFTYLLAGFLAFQRRDGNAERTTY